MAQQQASYLFVVTNFSGDPDRVAAPLVLANTALAGGADVLVWLTAEGASLARKGAADGLPAKSFSPNADLLKTFLENGGRIGVCPPCGKTHGVTDENMVMNGAWMGATAMLGAAEGRQVLSF